MWTPRYYQRNAINGCAFGWEFFDRQLLQMPTGSGKTDTVSYIFGEMQPKRCLFIADQEELCQQPRKAIQKVTGIIPALHKAKVMPSLKAAVVVGSSQTLAHESGKDSGIFRHLEYYPRDHFDFIYSDEIHRGIERDQKIWDYFATAKVLGGTATPYFRTLTNLTPWLPHVAYRMTITDLVLEGFAPPIKTIHVPLDLSLDGLKITKKFGEREYDKDAVDSTIAPLLGQIAGILRDEAKGRHGIAFLPLIRTSKAFAACLRAVGLRAEHVDGDTEDRDAILQQFERGEIDWLCCSKILSTGVDLPICDAFVDLRMLNSRAEYQQARGRGMRVLPGLIDHLPEKEQAAERRQIIANSSKPNLLVFDLLFQDDRLGCAHAGEDFCVNEHDAKALFERAKGIRGPVDLTELAKQVQQEREAALLAALERAAIRSSVNTPLTVQQAGALIGAYELADYEPLQPWEKQPPTEKQIESLARKGIDPSSIKSKGEANAVLSSLISRAELGYCSLKQVKLIKQQDEMKPADQRTPNPENLTSADAKEIIDRAFRERRRAVV